MDRQTVAAYDAEAGEYAARYDAATPGSLHRLLLGFLPPSGEVLEVGCGSGRDARLLAGSGYRVTATDASAELLKAAVGHTNSGNVFYRQAAFPLEEGHPLLARRFDAVVATAMVMHIPDADLFTFAFQLRSMLKERGRLLLSTSEGHAELETEVRKPDGRLFVERAPSRLQLLFERLGFRHVTTETTDDSLGRTEIRWHLLVFEMMASSGQTPINQIETIISQDKKTATYKFALLRAIADIAQDASSQARWHGQDDVSVPLGLITEKWVLYYWPLLEAERAIRQICSSTRLAFQPSLEALIAHYRGQNGLTGFYQAFVNDALDGPARGLVDAAFNKVAAAIVNGPVTFAGGALDGEARFFWHSGKKVAGGKCRSRREVLESLGRVHMRADVWREMCLVGHWIAEAIPLRWAELSFEMNKQSIPLETIIGRLLVSPVAERDQSDARRVFALRDDLACVWTGKAISDRFEVDHVIPFALWHNNDLWNLLPACKQANADKSDRLVTRQALQRSRDRIIDCWQFVQKQNPFRFEVEISRALLGRDFRASQWETQAFASLLEAVETTAIRRGVQRWEPQKMSADPALRMAGVTKPVSVGGSEAEDDGGAELEVIPFHEVGERKFRTALPVVGRLAAGPLASRFEHEGFEACDWVIVDARLAGPRRFVVRVAGDSMAPTLSRGDYCVFEYHRTPRERGQIVIVADFGHDTAGGEVAIKRFSGVEGGEWVFASDNPEHGGIRILQADEERPVLGTFVSRLGDGRPAK